MMLPPRKTLLAVSLVLVALTGPALVAAPVVKPAAKPAAASSGKTIDFQRDVKPLLVKRCYACHGNGTRLGGFQIDSREGVLTGSAATHPVVIPGKSAQSHLMRLVSGAIPGKVMPPKGARLSPAEVAVLRAWIDQGVSFGKAAGTAAWKPRLALTDPKVPAAPAGSNLTNPIDLLLEPYYRSQRIVPRPVVDDRTYARRVYLDLIGLLPTPEELSAFEQDRRPDKRAQLARKLLGENQAYTEHWLSFWNDLLRNDYVGTGYIDGGRAPISEWLYSSLMANKPFDQFVRELVNPTPASAGFVKGIVWRGVVNASQRPPMQAAQSISQVFMGVNLKCASCHDSFINNWKLADAYGMAAIYADERLELVRCDKPTGIYASIKFLYPELGPIDAGASKQQRTERLAAILTSQANGRLPRTYVNRLWAKLMGRGLVEPLDEMDERPWSPELLDWLASDLVKNGYDSRKLLERIVTSRAYQLPAVPLASESATGFVFSGPAVKRLSAEQFVDAVSGLTGVWYPSAPGAPMLLPPLQEHGGVRFRSGVLKSGFAEVDVDVTGARVLTLVALDGGNGANSDWANWCEPRLITPRGETSLTKVKWQSATTGYGRIQIDKNIVSRPLRLGTRTYPVGIGAHANSVITYVLPAGTTRFRATVGPDTGALENPGSQTSIEFMVLATEKPILQTRASLAVADPLMRALGRPNREQVVTRRSPVATTLEALELTNGQTLASMLAEGGKMWITAEDGKAQPTSVAIVDAIYRRALSRPPTPTERTGALELVGSPPRSEGVEDLLWALTALPEFQLIY
jgi:mono/diheme cytochrome c family protein